MKISLRRLLIVGTTIPLLVASSFQSSFAIDTSTFQCRAMLKVIEKQDFSGHKLWSAYTSAYEQARSSKSEVDNLKQTRILLELLENDRSIYLTALGKPKCFTSTDLKNIKMVLSNSTGDAATVTSWLDVDTGIPGANFYKTYLDFAKWIAHALSNNYCSKKGLKSGTLICSVVNGQLLWVNSSPTNELVQPYPTDFLEGKVNWRGAALRIQDFFKEKSTAGSSGSNLFVKFMQEHAYPGLYDFAVDPQETACRELRSVQDQVTDLKITYSSLISHLQIEPDWMITVATKGERIVGKRFDGQVFSVPVKFDVVGDKGSIPGIFNDVHLAILEGKVYEFEGC